MPFLEIDVESEKRLGFSDLQGSFMGSLKRGL